jgi:valyl-tRNA synthetase
MEITKEYEPREVEKRWLQEWENARLFEADPESGKPRFCMVIPPPNVTGNLHIGHVLVYTLHDIVARWHRMKGRDVLWLPGTDHAGIATQMVVERALAAENSSRHELGRDKFVERVWEWKDNYGGKITRGLRTLGSSCDWSRERFTLDAGLSRAVRAVFVRLYNEGLIYRDRYIVNWCPRCHTAISDLETVYREIPGKLYTVRYPAADGGGEITVATTRPETMLGDTGVAIHPGDSRFVEMVGRKIEVPLTGRKVPIIEDEFVDPAFGTGAVKITPGHDPNDFAAGRRHGLPELLVIDTNGCMTEHAGEFRGLDRYEARERVIEKLQEQGLLIKTEPHDHAVGHCQRCSTMIEPLVSRQWFVKVGAMAEEAIAAVEDGRTRFVPDSWSKTYFEWMRNIHDWCISRQLWWGHRIPAWYCEPCGEIHVSEQDPESCGKCGGELRQDDDVLDTWFSSALWPFSTLGWPDETVDLEHYYPTELLITGHDIIFFWVARMMMMGLKFMERVPFEEVYIHGLVRDADGQKMSKSKGNTVDPDEVQEKYGTDAVRFTMAILAAPGNDIPLAPERMEGYRAFANKLWNACRFVLMRVGEGSPGSYDRGKLTLADRWILSVTQKVVRDVDRALERYRFDQAADLLYHFVWHQFCDWYIEFVKPAFRSENGVGLETARSVLLEVLGTLLRLLHPMMPFITEELWQKMPNGASYISVAEWPVFDAGKVDEEAERELELIKETIVKTRNLRAESNISPSSRIELLLHAEDENAAAILSRESTILAAIVRAGEVRVVESFDERMIAARGVAGGVQIAIPLEGLLDLDAERSRLSKDLAKVEKQLQSRGRKLSNQSFLERAPAEVVKKERRLHQELAERRDKLESMLAAFGSGGQRESS